MPLLAVVAHQNNVQAVGGGGPPVGAILPWTLVVDGRRLVTVTASHKLSWKVNREREDLWLLGLADWPE